jgi:hypothetical protein
MKKVFLSVAILFNGALAFAQAPAESRTQYNKQDVPCVVAEFPYNPDMVETVILDDMKLKGFGKGSSSKGFKTFAGINFNEISADKIDFYISIDRKSKKEKERSVVYVLVSKSFESFIGSTQDSAVINKVIKYLNDLLPKFSAANLQAMVVTQEDVIKKEEKKYNNLVDDGTDLAKKKKKIEDQISENINNQAKQKAELEKQKQILETLKSKKQ